MKFRDSKGVQRKQSFPSKTAARTFRNKIRVAAAEGTLPDVGASKRTTADLWDAFVKSWRKKPSTLASYDARWRVHIEPVLGRRPLGKLTRAELETFYADVEKYASLDTRRKVQQVVHKLFATAVRWEWIAKSPADGIEMPSAAVQRESEALTEDEVSRIAAEVPDRYRALVWSLAETGARIGELVALRVGKLNGSIRIVENAPLVNGSHVVGTPKTKLSERVVPISARLRKMLHDHVSTYGNAFDPDSLVFTTESGKMVRQDLLLKRVIRPAARRAGIKRNGKLLQPRTHDLRHTAISLMLQRGMQPFEVSKIVGHIDLAMIQHRYGHLYSDEALQQKLDAVWSASCSTSRSRGATRPLHGDPTRSSLRSNEIDSLEGASTPPRTCTARVDGISSIQVPGCPFSSGARRSAPVPNGRTVPLVWRGASTAGRALRRQAGAQWTRRRLFGSVGYLSHNRI